MTVPDLPRERAVFERSLLSLLGHSDEELSEDQIGGTIPSALLSLLVRRRFRGGDVAEVTAYVAEALERLEMDSRGRVARVAEVMIRSELGQVELVESRLLSHAEVAELTWLLVADLVVRSELGPDEVTALLDQAERDGERFWARLRDRDVAPAGPVEWAMGAAR